MGLAIVHGPVTLLDGTITVYSEIKKGSTFIVSIPVQISEDERADEPAAANASLQQKPQQVTVVDDNKSVGDAFAALLDKLGYQHELCDSPERALQKLLRRPYDALLLDLQMPGIDGAARPAAAQPSRPQPPCADHRHQRLHAGAADGGPARPVRQLPDEAGPAGCAVERAGRGVPR